MTGRITKESWDLIFEGIMDVVGRNLADPDALKAELEDYLVSEEKELFFMLLKILITT